MFNKNSNVLVVGAGISGIAAVRLLAANGVNVTLFDSNEKSDIEKIKENVGNVEFSILTGDKNCPVKENFDAVVLSPGVPVDLPFINELRNRGIKIIGEVELAYMYGKGEIVAITGTNGKTTTTALTGDIMKNYFSQVFVVGNIGIPYTDMVSKMENDTVSVAEMSSFQLETVDEFRPHVAAILNITPDHLNRHHTMEGYIDAKCNIFKNQTEDDFLILNYNDPYLRELEKKKEIKSHIIWFSSTQEVQEGMFANENGEIFRKNEGRITKIIDAKDMNIVGKHNWENAMAGIAAGIIMGVPVPVIVKTLKSFKAVEHRIEYVKTIKGVKYYNDSKGTNPDASIKAVEAMTGPTVLIAGGYDKGSEYTEWIRCFNGKISHMLLMGATAEKIADTARELGFNDITFVNSMEEAVNKAYELSEKGGNVLLSPCCASWGMFKNYEERGRIFKDLVNKLPEE